MTSDQTQYQDDLTGAYNRRYLTEQVVGELTARIAGQRPFCLVMVDIDRFKEVNDTHGHQKGDEVIREFVSFLSGSIRGSDLMIRYGGDEFVCVMNDVVKNDAIPVLNRIAARCRDRRFANVAITLSAGIASFPGDGVSYEEVFASADRALYDAKRTGRDRISAVGDKKAEIPIRLFIDRVPEKEAIRAIMTNRGPRLRAAVIHGLVGVGKTRLSREILNGMKEREIIWSDCILFDKQLAYYVIRELIRYRFKRRGPDLFQNLAPVYLAEISKLVPEVIANIKDLPAASEIMDRYRLYESVKQFLDTGSREKIIVIDNIQWIDSESIEVLKYVTRALQDSPITFLFIHRVEELSEMLEDFLAFVSRDFETRDIPLMPFGAVETKEAVRAIIGEEPAADLVNYILSESGGIPLYIEEIVRGLLERKNLQIDEGNWRFNSPTEHILPGTVSDVALKKYRSLSHEAQQVMDIAVILGWFDLPLIRNITNFNEGHILGLINEINRLGIIKYGTDRYEFSAAVSRNAIYRKYLEGPRGIELHRLVGQNLEALNPGRENDLAEDLAYHYYTGRVPVRGAFFCRIAGDKARTKYANRDALRFYSWAVELLGPDPVRRRERLEMMLKKAEVITFTGKTQEALDLIGSMRQDVAELKDREFETSVLTLLMKIHMDRAQYDKVLEIGNELFGHYGRESMFTNKPEVLSFLSRAFYRQGHYEPALTHLTEALKICLDTRDEAAEAMVRINLGNVHHSVGDNAKALENYERCLDIHRRYNSLDGEARILTNLSIVYGDLGQTDRAHETVKRASEIFHLIGNRIDEARALNNLGSIYERDGRFEEARALYERALKNHRDIGNKEGIALVSLNLGNTYRNHDQDEKALAIFQEALQKAREVKSKNLIASTYLNQANVFLEQRRFDLIEGILDEIIKGSEISQELAVGSFAFLCDYFLTIGDEPRFLDALDRLSGLAKSVNLPLPEAHLRHLRGRYELNRGNLDQAYGDLRRGLELFQQLRDRGYVALSFYYLARLEMARGNESAYRDNINRAKQEFTQIKWSRWLNILVKEEESGDKEAVKG